MGTVCKKNKCVGCYACVDLCPQKAITLCDTGNALNAEINQDKCIRCNICYNACQVNHPVEKIKPLEWYQGWSQEDEIRKESSSGGLGAELAQTMINQGGIVCSCAFVDGKFGFYFAETIDELKKFSGSKYVKSNPKGVYTHVYKLMNDGQDVLFIGLPCQCAALKKSTAVIKKGNLYLVDLICHGSPSQRLLETFLKQYNYSLDSIRDISFRDKGNYALRVNCKSIVTPGTMDCYSIAFLNSLIFTENCYECNYSDSERISDLTIGDSWGSTLSDEGGKGISLVLCNTEKGKDLLDNTNVCLMDVDIEKAINANTQLREPPAIPKKREIFFEGNTKGVKFNKLVRKCCTKKYFRQFLKKELIKMRLIKRGE